MTDKERILKAVQEAQSILTDYIEVGPRGAEKTIKDLCPLVSSDD